MKQQVTFLTGASSGFGQALAPLIAKEGHAVALIARREGPIQQLATAIRDAGGSAMAVACDVTDRGSVKEAVKRCEQELGPVTRLVANAGIAEPNPGDKFDSTVFERIIRTNLIGVAYCVEAVVPGMVERKDGHIVGISSLAGFRGLPGVAGYCAAKAALTAMLESLRLDLRRHHIAVTTICPGFVKTAMTARNKSPMPFLMELDDAVKKMHSAIRKKKTLVTFPWPLATLTKVGRLMPSRLYDQFVSSTKITA